jgi:hypothetical protein
VACNKCDYCINALNFPLSSTGRSLLFTNIVIPYINNNILEYSLVKKYECCSCLLRDGRRGRIKLCGSLGGMLGAVISTVGIAAGYGLNRRGVGFRVPLGETFSPVHVVHTGSGAHPAS